MWTGSGIFRVSEHYCFIGGEVRNMSGLCSFTVMGLPKGHKLSIRQSSEDPSRINNGNCTEWSAIWAETIRVIFKIERARSASSI